MPAHALDAPFCPIHFRNCVLMVHAVVFPDGGNCGKCLTKRWNGVKGDVKRKQSFRSRIFLSGRGNPSFVDK